MPDFRVLAISEEVAKAVRRTLTSPRYGHPAHRELATGYGPCRFCLRFFEVGRENRLLFTFDPFAENGADPLPGPIFIHEEDCERYPEDAGFPSHLLEHQLTLSAYGTGRRLIREELVYDHVIEPIIQTLLERDEVRYLHVRDTGAGCFDLRIERSHDSV